MSATLTETPHGAHLSAAQAAATAATNHIGIFTVAHPPEHNARASRLLNILMDGLRPTP